MFSTSTRNFPNRLGKNSNVYLGSAELAAICSKLGRIQTREEYLNFDKIEEFTSAAEKVPASVRSAVDQRKSPLDAGLFCGAQAATLRSVRGGNSASADNIAGTAAARSSMRLLRASTMSIDTGKAARFC